ncbi:MAG TPA: hypothetical protein VH475_28940 [Tepidisphaeraceae bacterium]|jgi:hypothetical protein
MRRLLRVLPKAGVILLLLLCAAAAGLWIQSYFASDSVRSVRKERANDSWSVATTQVQASRGYVLFRRGVLILKNQAYIEQLVPDFTNDRDGTFWETDVPYDLKGMFKGGSIWNRMGFVAASDFQDSPEEYAANTFVLFPLWPMMLVTGLPSALIVRRRWIAFLRLRRQGRGLCPRCGYDVSHSESDRCPECGEARIPA